MGALATSTSGERSTLTTEPKYATVMLGGHVKLCTNAARQSLDFAAQPSIDRGQVRDLAIGWLISAFELFGTQQLDSEAFQAHETALRRGKISDGLDGQVTQDLCANADIAPLRHALVLAGDGIASDRHDWNTGSAVTQVHQHTPARASKAFQGTSDRAGRGENLRGDVRSMETGQHLAAVSDFAVDKGDVVHRVKG